MSEFGIWLVGFFIGVIITTIYFVVDWGTSDKHDEEKEYPKFYIKKFERTGEYFAIIETKRSREYLKYRTGNMVIGTDMIELAFRAKKKKYIHNIIENYKEQAEGGKLVEIVEY